MNMYELMKMSEKMDCEAFDYSDFETAELLDGRGGSDVEKFKEKYKEFYTDIKLSHKEDW